MPSISPSLEPQITDRDIALLTALLESRVMTVSHVAALHFDGRNEAARKRLQKLKSIGLIHHRPRKAYEAAVLFLGRKGFALLGERGVLANYPPLSLPQLQKRSRVSPLTLAHELNVMDAKQAICLAVAKVPGLSIDEFCTWPRLFQFLSHTPSGKRVMIRPDGFIRLREQEAEHLFFMELDRSTETVDLVMQRAHGYLSFYRAGGMAVRFGYSKEEYKSVPFRVMLLVPTAERRNNMAERLLLHNPPILTQFILTTLHEFEADPLGPIWIQPLDYRNATRDTPFDPADSRADPIYRRNVEREEHVERTILKHPLIEPQQLQP